MGGPVKPWESDWWPALCALAEKGGHSAANIIEEVGKGHAMGWPVDGGFMVLCRAEDDALVIWLCVGRSVRTWCAKAEREVSAFARAVGCRALRIEGRKGWRRILPHWTRVGDDLELPLT